MGIAATDGSDPVAARPGGPRDNDAGEQRVAKVIAEGGKLSAVDTDHVRRKARSVHREDKPVDSSAPGKHSPRQSTASPRGEASRPTSRTKEGGKAPRSRRTKEGGPGAIHAIRRGSAVTSSRAQSGRGLGGQREKAAGRLEGPGGGPDNVEAMGGDGGGPAIRGGENDGAGASDGIRRGDNEAKIGGKRRPKERKRAKTHSRGPWKLW